MTSKDPIRNGRNLAIIVVALATRAAIRGGVLPEVAMSLSDVYIQRIEELPNIIEIGTLTQAAERELTELVVAAKNRISEGRVPGENPVIRNRLHPWLHLSKPSWKPFKNSTGMTLLEYRKRYRRTEV